MSSPNPALKVVPVVTEPAPASASTPTKRCRVCGPTRGPLPISAFPPHPKSHDGRFNTCSACLSRKQIAVAQETAALKARRAAEPTQPTLSEPRPTSQLREVRYHVGIGEVIQPAEQRRRDDLAQAQERIANLEIALRRAGEAREAAEANERDAHDAHVAAIAEMEALRETVGRYQRLAHKPTIALYKWLTEPTPAPAHGEGLLIPTEAEGALLVLRRRDDFYLLSGAPDLWPTPDRAIDPEVLLYIVRLKTNTSAADDEIEGVRFA